jgi:hypothetical protein
MILSLRKAMEPDLEQLDTYVMKSLLMYSKDVT